MLRLSSATRASFSYDAAGRLASLYNLKSDSLVISSFDYGYDNVGNRKHVAEAGGDRVTWTYDDTNQLTAEHRSGASAYSHTFSYDPNGNRLVQDTSTELTTSTYDPANRLLTAEDNSGVTTYAYDADGNQQTKEVPNGDLTTNTWSYENKLTQLEEPTGDTTDYAFALVQRNGTEQRVSKDDGVDVTRFVWDGKQMLLEVTDVGVIEARYDYTPDSFGDLISQHQNLETNYHHFDGLGSTSDLTDSAEVVTDDYAYEAFGKEVTSTGTTPNPHRWVGELGYYKDEESSLYSIQQRTYDTGTGRLQSQDPIADDESNLYRYVGNNSLNDVDPSGLEWTSLSNSLGVLPPPQLLSETPFFTDSDGENYPYSYVGNNAVNAVDLSGLEWTSLSNSLGVLPPAPPLSDDPFGIDGDGDLLLAQKGGRPRRRPQRRGGFAQGRPHRLHPRYRNKNNSPRDFTWREYEDYEREVHRSRLEEWNQGGGKTGTPTFLTRPTIPTRLPQNTADLPETKPCRDLPEAKSFRPTRFR